MFCVSVGSQQRKVSRENVNPGMFFTVQKQLVLYLKLPFFHFVTAFSI